MIQSIEKKNYVYIIIIIDAWFDYLSCLALFNPLGAVIEIRNLTACAMLAPCL